MVFNIIKTDFSIEESVLISHLDSRILQHEML